MVVSLIMKTLSSKKKKRKAEEVQLYYIRKNELALYSCQELHLLITFLLIKKCIILSLYSSELFYE